MKKITFSEPVTGRAFFDFVPLFTKKDFNDTVTNIQALLKRHRVNCKTSSLKEWLSKAAGYNSAAHLLSELPLAFNGMRAIYELNLMLNQNTQWALYFNALDYQRLKDSVLLDLNGNWSERLRTINEDHSTIQEQAKKKVEGTSYDVITIHSSSRSFFDYVENLHPDNWHYCFRASSLIDVFPTYHIYRELSMPSVDVSDEVNNAFDNLDGTIKSYCLDDVLFNMEESESVFMGYIDELPTELISVISSYLLKLADEQNIACSEGIIFRELPDEKNKGFAPWLAGQKERDDIVSDLAIDAARDPEFARNATSYVNTLRHIARIAGKYGIIDISHVRDAAKSAWKEFLSLNTQ